MPAAIAYFSPEYGITAALPQYSGGLGILAGDHLKAASDLGVPLIGVGLLYRHGYFTQSLSAGRLAGRALSGLRPERAAADAAARRGRHRACGCRSGWPTGPGWPPRSGSPRWAGCRCCCSTPTSRKTTRACARSPTGCTAVAPTTGCARNCCSASGGVRAVRAYCALTGHAAPEVFHTNEGHAGFLGLERIREYVQQGMGFDEALEVCRAGTVFTTHTPVAAGIDRFPLDLVERNVGEGAEVGLPADRILALGAESYPGGDPGVFNMAVMGMRLAQRVNGVSKLHGEVSRSMFTGLWPGFDAAEVPITSVTNGVHAPTWVAPEVFALAGEQRRGSSARRPADPSDDPEFWQRVAADPRRLWEVRRMLRGRLIEEARRRLRASWRQRGASDAELIWTDSVLDEDVLTIGFARRVPSYKRLTMMLHDPARLTGLLLDPERPVQIVVAGKAHPADEGGKQLIQELVRFADGQQVRHRIVFLPDYDMALAQTMVAGCDVWLNNPLRPLEACGTSGMKAALNGALNLSVLDGWWDEWFDGHNGWAIPSADAVTDPSRRDELEAAALYDLLAGSVAPLFYQAGRDGLPERWLQMVAPTLRTLGPKALATRMVRQYVTELYAPAASSSRVLAGQADDDPGDDEDDFAAARELAAWKQRVISAWPGVRIEHVEADDGELRPGGWLTVRASVALGVLQPEDVTVEVVFGRAGDADEIIDPVAAPLRLDGAVTDGVARFSGGADLGQPGPFGYTIRVLPRHRLLAGPAELGLVTIPDAPTGLVNGDLR